MISLRQKYRIRRMWRQLENMLMIAVMLAVAFMAGWLIARVTAF